MTRENLLFAIIGVLLGFIVGFIFASTMSQRYAPGAPAAAPSAQNLPADHPPVQAGDPQNPQAIFGNRVLHRQQHRRERQPETASDQTHAN